MRRGTPLASIIVVTVALFTDSFVYGLLIPLVARSPVAGEDASTVAVTFCAYGLGVLLATPIVGPLTDRVGRRLPFLFGLGCLCLATVLFAGASTLPLLLAARVVQGIASTATWTAGLALIADSFVRRRTGMLGIAMAGSSGGSVFGPLVGGLLLELGGQPWPFIVGGLLLAMDGLLRLILVVDAPRAAGARTNLWRLLRDRGVLAATLVVVLGAGGWSLIEPLLPAHLLRVAGSGPATIGLMFTVSTLTNGLSAPWIGNLAERYGLWPTMRVGVVVMAVALPALALPASVFLITGVLVLLNVSYGVVMNPSLSELAEVVDHRGTSAYGAVYVIYNVGFSVGQIGSTLVGGALSSSVSFLGALVVTSLVLLGCVPVISSMRLRTAGVAPVAD
jgi:MFS transporter, DHA1 family, solute carrier family 18 (vesicular amine transporter), member 1/2